MARQNVAGGSPWENKAGYSRLVAVGQHVFVSGTTATLPEGGHTGEGDAYAQACQAIRNIERALGQAEATLGDIVRTRLYVTHIARDAAAVARAHAEFFGEIRPAATMVEVRALIEPWMLIEIEVDALIGAAER